MSLTIIIYHCPLFASRNHLKVHKQIQGYARIRKGPPKRSLPNPVKSLSSVSFAFTAAGSAVPAKRSLIKAGLKSGIVASARFGLLSAAGRFRSSAGRFGLLFATAAGRSAHPVLSAEK